MYEPITIEPNLTKTNRQRRPVQHNLRPSIVEEKPDLDPGVYYKLIPCLCIYDGKYIFLWFDWDTNEPTWLNRDYGNTWGYADEIEEYYILPDLN